jgi:hypothetical protein
MRRVANIIPAGRTMTREQWKAIDRALRKSSPAIIEAAMDLMLYGTGMVELDADGRAHHRVLQVDGKPARGYIPPASMTGAAGASDTGRCCGVARRSPAGRFTFEGEQ